MPSFFPFTDHQQLPLSGPMTNGVSHKEYARSRSGSISDSVIDYGIIKIDMNAVPVNEIPGSPVSSDMIDAIDRRFVEKICHAVHSDGVMRPQPQDMDHAEEQADDQLLCRHC